MWEKVLSAELGFGFCNRKKPALCSLARNALAHCLRARFSACFRLATGVKFIFQPSTLITFLRRGLCNNGKPNQEQKIMCLIHYFHRICSCMPKGFVSFERKVLPLEQNHLQISYPEATFWNKSTAPLCSLEVLHSGFIEDQQYEAFEVDFSNEYLGGGALHRGCVQEEIRFMINPELIAGMLFLPCMESNEAIEIVGAERFANYTGYASSFRFMGDFMDKKSLDSLGRRKTRIVAIDALCNPRTRQYKSKNLIRETNKAFCGFLYHAKHQSYLKDPPQFASDNIDSGPGNESMDYEAQDNCHIGYTSLTITENCHAQKSLCSISGSEENSIFIESSLHVENESEPTVDAHENSRHGDRAGSITEINIGIATGNWGCGAFGGDPELKCMIQWLSASQALRPFVLYYTFGEAALQRLEEVSSWILSHNWTVGDLWSILNEYSSKRLNGETDVGFFSWLLPSVQEENHSINTVEEMMSE